MLGDKPGTCAGLISGVPAGTEAQLQNASNGSGTNSLKDLASVKKQFFVQFLCLFLMANVLNNNREK
jgi:hypothetical protein